MQVPDATLTPLAPPPIPWLRRFARFALGLSPFVVWVGVLALAFWLSRQEPAPGHVLAMASYDEARVVMPLEGRIAEVRFEVGQEVSSGDIVARLDTQDLDAKVRMAKAKVQQAQTRIAAAEEELRLEFEDRKTQAEARRRAHESDAQRRRAAIEQIAAADATDRAELAGLVPQIERLVSLRDRRLTTVDRLEELQSQRKVLEETVMARSDRLRGAREDLATWVMLEPEAPAMPDFDMRLLPVRLQVEQQEERLTELELEREKYALRAPLSGRVHRVFAHPGEWHTAGETLIEILVPRPGCMTAYVKGPRASEVAPGDTATLRVREGRSEVLRGRIVMVGARHELVPEALRAFVQIPEWGRMIRIRVDDDGDAVPGEIFSVRFD